MKTTKLVIGILSFVLVIPITFMSCAAGAVSGISGNAKDSSGGSGLFMALFMIVAGIIAVAGKKSRGGAIAATIAYIIAGIIGVTVSGLYQDLIIWGILNFAFAAVCAISIFVQNYKAEKIEKA